MSLRVLGVLSTAIALAMGAAAAYSNDDLKIEAVRTARTWC